NVRHQLTVMKGCVFAGLNGTALFRSHPAIHAAITQFAVPEAAKLLGRDSDRSHTESRLDSQDSEVALDSSRTQGAHGNIAHQRTQLDMRYRIFARYTHGYVIGDREDFRLEVDSQFVRRQGHRLIPGHEAVRDTLIHQRLLVEVRRHLLATGTTV